jgi:alkylation response protein AidB-like acyl-CoA dehydrogenase
MTLLATQDFEEPARGFEGIGDGADARKVVAHLAQAGFTAVVVPPGRDVDVTMLCAARAALAYHSAMADSILACIGLGSYPLMLAGGDAAERWLIPTASGEACAGFALTEPEAGSDVAGMQARAERVEGG